MKPFYFSLLFAFLSLNINAQNTYVPDDNFEQALIDLGYDSGPLDDYVPTSNINAVIWLNLNNKGISDLTGIEDFTTLRELYCYSNNLNSLDVSNNSELLVLFCWSNSLTSLDLSNNTALVNLDVNNNSLTSLDVSNNIALKFLNVSFNNLTSLDVSNNALLDRLSCVSNNLTNLGVNNNVGLTSLVCHTNSLTSLNVSKNIMLSVLSVSFNNLTSLDVSKNITLTNLSCKFNSLDRLNLINNELLETLECNNNELIGINLKNGNNTNISYFYTINNPDLECIQVDDASYSSANWTNVDPTSNFRKNCYYVATYGNRNSQELSDLKNDAFSNHEVLLYPNPVNDVITVSIQADAHYTIHNINGQQLLDGKLKGGENNLNLSQLKAGLYILNIIKDGISVSKKLIKN